MGKMKAISYSLDLLNSAAGLNDMIVTFEDHDGEMKYVLRVDGTDRIVAAYINEDAMYGFLDGLDYNRTGRGPAE